MTTTYAFQFDSAACSGCKACQIACKDKNQLPAGIVWRRVYEISGGGWQKAGQTWKTDVFAYNLSMACNHCVHPKCAGVCPTNAYSVRPDGIVLLDEEKCIGCKYCAWACPYGAPQYDPVTGRISKCDLCCDHLDSGSLPACVTSCPMRTLELVEEAEPVTHTRGQSSVFPLPVDSNTGPRLVINPHPIADRLADKTLANEEEIRPRKPGRFDELPLLVFTLLVQMAVGGFWAAEWMFSMLRAQAEFYSPLLRGTPYLICGVLLGIGALASLAHLGVKHRAWRALAHLRKSWLSREILFLGFFGAGCLLSLTPLPWQGGMIARIMTALLGAVLVYCMAQVYHLHTVPSWDSWRTTVGFFVTASLLGMLLMSNLLVTEAHFTGIQLTPLQFTHVGVLTMVLLAVQLVLVVSARYPVPGTVFWMRIGLILAGLAGGTSLLLLPFLHSVRLIFPLFVLILGEEVIGRWCFYAARHNPL